MGVGAVWFGVVGFFGVEGLVLEFEYVGGVCGCDEDGFVVVVAAS